MVKLGENTPTEDLFSAVDRLLENGAAGAKIAEMVAERIATHPTVETATDIVDYLDHADEDDCEVIYEPGEVPDGLIDLPSAAKKYGIPVRTLRTWVYLGRLPRRGRLKAPAAGGGYIVTVDEEIPRCRDNPRKPGRKPKVLS